MSQINELIEKLCPNGVEWKTLGEVLKYEQPTKYIVESNDYSNEGTPVLTAGATFLLGYTEEINGIYTASKDNPVIIFDDFTTSFHWVDFDFKVKSSAMKMLKPINKKVNFRYVYYSMCEIKYIPVEHSRQWIGTYSQFPIPLPPLEIQNRIVEILDHFTDLTANLTAELALRRKQFEHFREKLLSLDGVEGVEMKKLFDVAKNSTGLTYKPSDVSDSGTLVLRSSNIQNSMLCFDDNVFVQMASIPARALVKENDILVCVRNGSSALIGKAAIIDKSCDGMAFGAFMTILRAFNINYKYLYYVWQSDRVQKMVHGDSGAPINQITNAVLDKIMIPCPSDNVQQSIVAKLDKFTALIQNIENELALRQKQYEYYREKLLSFPSPSL